MANNEIKLDKKATNYLKGKLGGGGTDLGAQYQNCNKIYDLFNAACPYDETLETYKQTKLDTSKLKALLLAANLDLTKPIQENGSGNTLCICVPPILCYGMFGVPALSSSEYAYIVYNIVVTIDSHSSAPTEINLYAENNMYIDSFGINSSETPHMAALTLSSTFADLLDAMISDNINFNAAFNDSEYYKPIPFHNLGWLGSGNEIKNAPVFTTIISFIALNDDYGTDIISDNIYFDDFIDCFYEVEE